MKAVPCSDRDLALPGGVLLAGWQLLCSYKPRARACTSVTLKSKDAYRQFGHECRTLRRTLPLTSPEEKMSDPDSGTFLASRSQRCRNDRRGERMRSAAVRRSHGTKPRDSVKLQLQAEERGVVSIKGVSANRFLAMKEDGRLLALKCATEECFFFERLESNNYNTYRSRKYSDWYVALKRTGQYKPGPKTGPGQKAILFLPMSAKS
ncbi:PREDICTED: fibroblast growth factor 2 [Pygoscelis adeliae]|nr:PREDICTED: fibroblast growth factor 2 [Pygoscelis adeliae]